MKAIVLALCAGLALAGSARTVSISGVNREAGVPASLSLGFGEAEDGETNTLVIAYGPSDAGETLSDWAHTKIVKVIPPEMTETACALPADWMGDTKAVRCFLCAGGNVAYDSELEYIAGTGLAETKGAALRLDFTPTAKTRIALSATQTASGGNQCLFCARGSANLYDRTFTAFFLGKSVRFDYGTKTGTTYSLALGTHDYVFDYHGLQIDGTIVTKDYGTLGSFTAGYKLTLFASYTDGKATVNSNYGKWRLSTFKIWSDTDDETSLVHDFIPVTKDGRAGLYDKVNQTILHANCGSGDFEAGPAIGLGSVESMTETYVAPADESATWTGADMVALDSAAGWKDGVVPSLYSGATLATFTESAAENAVVPGSVYLRGIVFSNATSTTSFRFKPKTDGASVAIGAGGLTTGEHATEHWFGFYTPVMLAQAQTWSLGTNGNITVRGPISARDGAELTIKSRCAGNLAQIQLYSPSDNTNAVTVLGDPDVLMQSSSCMTLTCYTNNATGVGPLWVDNQRVRLLFQGNFTVDTPITTSVVSNDWCKDVFFDGNLVFNGPFQALRTNIKPSFTRGKTVIFSNTVTTASSMYCQERGGPGTSEVIFTKKLTVNDRFNVATHQRVTLNAPRNVINGNKGGISGTIRCGCAYALAWDSSTSGRKTVFWPSPTGVLDLNGFDQSVACIYPNNLAAPGGTVTSATPATLHLVDNYMVESYDSQQKDAAGKSIRAPGLTNYCAFAGCASLSKEGPFTNRLVKVSTTTGDLSVTNGLLVFASSATWLNASNVTVKTKGRFRMEDRTSALPQPFGKQLDFHVESPASVELLNASPVRVHGLTIDGVEADYPSYWGSEEAKAANPGVKVQTSSVFSGTGLLFVRGNPGCILILK